MTNENQDNGGGVAFDLDDIRSLAVTLMTEGRGPEYKVAESAWHEITHLRSTHADLLAALKDVEWRGKEICRSGVVSVCPSCDGVRPGDQFSDKYHPSRIGHINRCKLHLSIAAAEAGGAS